MKIKLIYFGVQKDHCPFRPHDNNAGADVFMPYDCSVKSGEILKTPWDMELKFRMDMPDISYPEAVWPLRD